MRGGIVPAILPKWKRGRKEIHYSSRTRASTDQFKHSQRVRNTVAPPLDDLPESMKGHPAAELLRPVADRKVYNLVHLIRARTYEGYSKDYEFSRSRMERHWRAGYNDTVRTLRHPSVLVRPIDPDSVNSFDVDRNDHG
jgi:NTE family protein